LIRTEDDQDGSLVEDFLEAMHITGCDFTNGFRLLNKMPLPQSEEDQRYDLPVFLTVRVDVHPL
jgi:uncharacterized protein YdiU (UPF0061 family)